MVHSFFVQTLNPDKCRIIYSMGFFHSRETRTTHLETNKGDISVNSYQSTTPTLQAIAKNVAKTVTFYRNKFQRSSYEDEFFKAKDDDIIPDLPHGLIKSKLANDDKEKICLWQAGFSCAFILIIEENENVTLAKNTLTLIVKMLQNKLQAMTQPSEVLYRPDRVNIILKRIIPNGQLLFINSRILRFIEKDIDSKNSQ